MTHNDIQKYGSLKREAKMNTDRIHPLGVAVHENTMRLFVQPGLDILAADCEPDERCGTCAFRSGTVPAGCMQTQSDALKAILEDVPFMCHAHEVNGGHDRLCHGWFAARVLMGDKKVKAAWPWVDEMRDEIGAQASEGVEL